MLNVCEMLRSLRGPFHSSCFFSSFFWWYISRIGTCYAITYGVLLKVHHTFVFFMLNYQPSHFFGILSKSYTSLFYFNFKIQFPHLGIPWSHVWDGGWGEPRPRPGQNQNLENHSVSCNFRRNNPKNTLQKNFKNGCRYCMMRKQSEVNE